MKAKGLLLLFILISSITFGQITVIGVVKKAYPELFGELKVDSTTKCDANNSKVNAYKKLFVKLEEGIDEIKNYEMGTFSTAEEAEGILQHFEFKDLKKLDKEGKLDSLKNYLTTKRKMIHDFMKWSVRFGADTLRGMQTAQRFRDAYKAKDYDKALKAWSILFNDYPISLRSIYLKGPIVLNKIIKKTKDSTLRAKYIDTLFLTYEQFFKVEDKLYPDENKRKEKEAYIYAKYAYNLYNYYVDKHDLESEETRKNIRKVYDLSMKSIELGKENTPYYIFPIAMKMAFFLYKMGEIPEEQALDNYMTFSDYLQKQYENAKGKKAEKIKKYGINILDNIFTKSDLSSCPNLCKAFNKQFEIKKDNPEFLKKILTILSARAEDGCTDSLIFEKAVKQLYTLEPSYEAAYRLALLYASKEKYEDAAKYYEEVLAKYPQEDTVKAQYYFETAQIYNKLKNYPKAREYALKAAELKPNFGKPYILIAMMYAASANACGSDDFAHRAVYWAAVDKLIKAKSIDPSVADEANALINTYSARYPQKREGFFRQIYEGDTYTISGCWINETTKVRYLK